uniref:(California timema) hypothetical protein n=1 Tax=Timema californicum TaxID=61474 RepID=A0A7R9J527_TIMCA|nr:unnamed protein product [Timema californicum]
MVRKKSSTPHEPDSNVHGVPIRLYSVEVGLVSTLFRTVVMDGYKEASHRLNNSSLLRDNEWLGCVPKQTHVVGHVGYVVLADQSIFRLLLEKRTTNGRAGLEVTVRCRRYYRVNAEKFLIANRNRLLERLDAIYKRIPADSAQMFVVIMAARRIGVLAALSEEHLSHNMTSSTGARGGTSIHGNVNILLSGPRLSNVPTQKFLDLNGEELAHGGLILLYVEVGVQISTRCDWERGKEGEEVSHLIAAPLKNNIDNKNRFRAVWIQFISSLYDHKQNSVSTFKI